MPKPLLLLLAGALAAAPATAGKIELTAEEHAQCESEGGCQVVTTQFLRSVFREGVEQGRASCSSRT